MALPIASYLKTLLIATVWLALAGSLFYLINLQVHPNTAAQLASSPEVTLKRDLAGHYRAEAFINGIKTAVMVDTGATDVAISQSLADKLGLHSITAVRTETANGETVSYMTRLATVQLGGIVAHDVSASITPRLGDEMLLGMSFLNRMDVRLYQGNMTIRAIHD